MKKINKPKNGGGGGKLFFKGDFFQVSAWCWSGGSLIFTEIRLNGVDEEKFCICFEGDRRYLFKSDEDCLKKLSYKDTLKAINLISESSFDKGFEEGKNSIKRGLQDLIFN